MSEPKLMACPLCSDTGYLNHHPKCPNRKPTKPTSELDAIIVDAWQEFKEQMICGESFAQRIKPYFLRAIQVWKAKKDTERLDWLEKHGDMLQQRGDYWEFLHTDGHWVKEAVCPRAAIDEAMVASPSRE